MSANSEKEEEQRPDAVRPSQTDLLLVGGRVDLRLGVVQRDGATERLTTKELQVLRYLVERQGQAVAQEDLLRDVWGYKRPTRTRSVYTAVKRLRAKIERDPAEPRHVLTVHGEGYCFEPCREVPADRSHKARYRT